jgi:hypothetical protein
MSINSIFRLLPVAFVHVCVCFFISTRIGLFRVAQCRCQMTQCRKRKTSDLYVFHRCTKAHRNIGVFTERHVI